MPANTLGVIERYYPDLNATDRQVADYVRANPVDASRLPIDRVAEEVGVSKSTLVRFAQKVGYAGYAALKQDLARQLLSHQGSDPEGTPACTSARIANTYVDYLRQLAATLDDADLRALAGLVCQANHLVVAGYDRSFHSASQLSKRLLNVGVRSYATYDLGSLHNGFGLYDERDLLVLFTVTDSTRGFVEHLPQLREAGMRVACVTMSPALPFRRLCDRYVTLPRVSRDPEVMFLDDQAVFFVFIEILIDAVAKRMSTPAATATEGA